MLTPHLIGFATWGKGRFGEQNIVFRVFSPEVSSFS